MVPPALPAAPRTLLLPLRLTQSGEAWSWRTWGSSASMCPLGTQAANQVGVLRTTPAGLPSGQGVLTVNSGYTE